MEEQNTSEIIKIFIEMIMVLGVLALFFLGFNLHKMSSFKQEVNYAIERQGGINDKSLKTIKTISDNYKGYFTVYEFTYDKDHDGSVASGEGKVSSGNPDKMVSGIEPQQYGTKFLYKFQVKIPIPFMSYVNSGNDGVSPIPSHFTAEGRGTATSKVRTDTDK